MVCYTILLCLLSSLSQVKIYKDGNLRSNSCHIDNHPFDVGQRGQRMKGGARKSDHDAGGDGGRPDVGERKLTNLEPGPVKI
jgi:hypothetical protein